MWLELANIQVYVYCRWENDLDAKMRSIFELYQQNIWRADTVEGRQNLSAARHQVKEVQQTAYVTCSCCKSTLMDRNCARCIYGQLSHHFPVQLRHIWLNDLVRRLQAMDKQNTDSWTTWWFGNDQSAAERSQAQLETAAKKPLLYIRCALILEQQMPCHARRFCLLISSAWTLQAG